MRYVILWLFVSCPLLGIVGSHGALLTDVYFLDNTDKNLNRNSGFPLQNLAGKSSSHSNHIFFLVTVLCNCFWCLFSMYSNECSEKCKLCHPRACTKIMLHDTLCLGLREFYDMNRIKSKWILLRILSITCNSSVPQQRSLLNIQVTVTAWNITRTFDSNIIFHRIEFKREKSIVVFPVWPSQLNLTNVSNYLRVFNDPLSIVFMG